MPTRLIRWEFVNLIEPDPLRRVKLRITHQKLEKMHPADLADIMEELSPAERQAIIASLDEQTAAEALAELDSRLTSQIVEKLAPEQSGGHYRGDGAGQGGGRACRACRRRFRRTCWMRCPGKRRGEVTGAAEIR